MKKFKILQYRKGQSTVEYAIVLGVIVAALIAMQTYIKRGIQGRYRDGTEFLATETPQIGTTEQYEPYYTSSAYDVAQAKSVTETVGNRGDTSKTGMASSSTRAVGGNTQYGDTSAAD